MKNRGKNVGKVQNWYSINWSSRKQNMSPEIWIGFVLSDWTKL